MTAETKALFAAFREEARRGFKSTGNRDVRDTTICRLLTICTALTEEVESLVAGKEAAQERMAKARAARGAKAP